MLLCYCASYNVQISPVQCRKDCSLDRLCLEKSLKEIDYVWKIPSKRVRPMSVDCLSVCCKKHYITIKQTQNVLLLSLLQIMFKGNRNSYDNNVVFSCPLF